MREAMKQRGKRASAELDVERLSEEGESNDNLCKQEEEADTKRRRRLWRYWKP
jgi:hypothetical protein